MDSSTSTIETLARLSSKPGVQSTLILSRSDGLIIRSSGFAATEHSDSDAESAGESRNTLDMEDNAPSGKPSLLSSTDDRQQTTPEEIARAIYRYVTEAENLTRIARSGEDIQLMRLRTRRQEIVIVPDQKYLMVVIQDAPRAS